jgi:hypothetical protein
MTHDDVDYQSVAMPSWTDATEVTHGGDTYLQGTCPRCNGPTARRLGTIVVQGNKQPPKPKPFVIKCACGHTTHKGRPEKTQLGCGAYWYSEPVQV